MEATKGGGRQTPSSATAKYRKTTIKRRNGHAEGGRRKREKKCTESRGSWDCRNGRRHGIKAAKRDEARRERERKRTAAAKTGPPNYKTKEKKTAKEGKKTKRKKARR